MLIVQFYPEKLVSKQGPTLYDLFTYEDIELKSCCYTIYNVDRIQGYIYVSFTPLRRIDVIKK